MRAGDVLNGYELVTDPTNAGGGMSQWAFARKDGADYFVKMFLAPKYPVEGTPGSDPAKSRKREVCQAFEARHLEIARRLDPSKPGAGNLVVTNDFFRVRATYVKVMDKVEALPFPMPGTAPPLDVLVLLRSLAFSLRMLHDEQVVHGDIKPDNVMVERTAAGVLVSKVIDFDEAYVVGSPPSPELIVGDPSYYSPELLRYIKRDPTLPADALGTASDMFSVGLLLHVLLVGSLPRFDRSQARYPAEALLLRTPLAVDAAPPVLQPLLARLLAIVPSRRPSIHEVVDFLADVDPLALVPGWDSADGSAESGRLRGTVGRRPGTRPAGQEGHR